MESQATLIQFCVCDIESRGSALKYRGALLEPHALGLCLLPPEHGGHAPSLAHKENKQHSESVIIVKPGFLSLALSLASKIQESHLLSLSLCM